MLFRSLLPIVPLPALAVALLIFGGCFQGSNALGRTRAVPSYPESEGLEPATSFDGNWEVTDARSSSGSVSLLPVGASLQIENGELTTQLLETIELSRDSRGVERHLDFLTNGVDESGLLRYRLGETLNGELLALGSRGERWTTMHRSVALTAGCPVESGDADAEIEDVTLDDSTWYRDSERPISIELPSTDGPVGPRHLELRLNLQTTAFEQDSNEPRTLVDDHLVITVKRVDL